MTRLRRRWGLRRTAAALTGEASLQPSASSTTVARGTLFRQEVLDFQQHDRQWGRVVPLQPLSIRLTAWFVVLCVAGVAVFLFFAHYARKETALGYVAQASGSAKVFASQPGVVSELFVQQGQTVKQGEPLLTVTTSQLAAGGQDVNKALLATLEQQKKSLTAQVAVEMARTNEESTRLAERIRNLESELDHLDKEAEIQRQRITLMERLAETGAKLRVKGLVSEIDQRRREDSVLEYRRNLISLEEQISQRRSQLTDGRTDLTQLPFVHAEKVQNIRNELSSVEQRLTEVNARRSYVVSAPVSGVVSLLQASVGQSVDPKRLQLEIRPHDDVLQAELFVPARAMGLVEVGQEVRILYDAFPYQKYGTYSGHVISVSHTALTASDVSAPVPLKEVAYRVTVALDRQEVDVNGRKIPVQPDMLLKADIILERRTLVEWLLEPILSVRMQG
ncbi:MAG: HlyD family efflux transporter periplasmic adaptor subunit [Acetobacteraceae bacterium]